MVSNGGLVLKGSACKDMISGGATVDGVSQNVKLGSPKSLISWDN